MCSEEWLLRPYIMGCLTPLDRDAFCANPARNAKLLISKQALTSVHTSVSASQTLMNSSQNLPKLKWSEPPTEFKPQFQAYLVIMTAQLKLDVSEPDSACDTETLHLQILIPNHKAAQQSQNSCLRTWVAHQILSIYIYICTITLKIHKQQYLVEYWAKLFHQQKAGILS